MHVQFKVTLEHCTPKIWRRFTLSEGATFDTLHEAIQDSFGWEYAHLWQFHTAGATREVLAATDESELEMPFAEEIPLSGFFTQPGVKCIYWYDFGDDWTHEVVFEGAADAPEGGEGRALIAGELACPPEDCGGPPGYDRIATFARTGVDPHGEPAEALRAQLGGWDPDAFDLEEAKADFGSGDLLVPVDEDGAGDEVDIMRLLGMSGSPDELGVGDLSRPGWLDDALAARLLRALEACRTRPPELENAYLGNIERGGDVVRFVISLGEEGGFPRWNTGAERDGAQISASCVAQEGEGWFDGRESTLEPMPTHVLVPGMFGANAPSREVFEDYTLSVEALAGLLARYAARPELLPDLDSDGLYVPLFDHVASEHGVTTIVGPLG